MTTRDDVLPYLRRIADLVGLKDWSVRVSPDPPDDPTSVADVLRPKGRKVATVRLADRFFREPEEEQRDTILHELLHCHGAPLDSYAIDKLSDSDFLSYRYIREYEVDGMAAALAPLFPLPSAVLRDRSTKFSPKRRK